MIAGPWSTNAATRPGGKAFSSAIAFSLPQSSWAWKRIARSATRSWPSSSVPAKVKAALLQKITATANQTMLRLSSSRASAAARPGSANRIRKGVARYCSVATSSAIAPNASTSNRARPRGAKTVIASANTP